MGKDTLDGLRCLLPSEDPVCKGCNRFGRFGFKPELDVVRDLSRLLVVEGYVEHAGVYLFEVDRFAADK